MIIKCVGGKLFKSNRRGTFLGGPVVKTLTSSEAGMGSIPGWGAKISQALWPKKKKKKHIKQNQYCNRFNTTLKMVQISGCITSQLYDLGQVT